VTIPPHGTRDDEPIVDLLRRLRGEIERVLSAFQLDERAAEEVLQEILLMLIYRWDRIANRELWLLATLKRSCLRRAHERQSHERPC
jgi:DNA-directed RNA polymerase specialized sigma24 family protein